jgi:hypothetical protein
LANRGNQTEVKISFDELLTEHPYNFNLHCRFDTCATCLLPVRSVSCFTAKTNQTISDNDITIVMPSSMQSNVVQNYKIYEQLTQVQRTACGGTLGRQQCNYINMSMVGRDGAHICDPIVLIFELAWLGHLDWLKFGIALLTWLIPHLPKWKNAKLDRKITQRSLIHSGQVDCREKMESKIQKPQPRSQPPAQTLTAVGIFEHCSYSLHYHCPLDLSISNW